MDEVEAIESLGALAQDTRLKVFRLLVEHAPDGLPAGAVARHCGVPANTMSVHLGILARAGLITARRDSRQVFYAADFPGLRRLIGFLLRDCCKGHPDLCEPLLDAVLPATACCPPPPTRRNDA